MIENSRDFINTYLGTGRKLPVVQSEKAQADLIIREVPAKEKTVPGSNKTTKVPAYDKIISKSKCPKYSK